jgi:hypothetical protein
MLVITGCYRTENGLVFGKPDYEKRDILVAEIDLKILLRANELLADEKSWHRKSERECNNQEPYSLYCALKKSSIEVNGNYIHRQPAFQEVRFVIDDLYKDYWEVHRLADFNSNEKTSHEDIKKVLTVAIERVKKKLQR